VIAWLKDEKAVGGFCSQWVERIDGKPKVASERPGGAVASE
jgi:hypothetical protein